MKLQTNNLRIQFLIAFIAASLLVSCHAFKKIELREPQKVEEKSDALPSPTPIQRSNESTIDHTRKSTWQYTTTKALSADGWGEIKVINQNLWWAWNGKAFYKTNDNGNTWQPIKLPLSKGDKIAAIEFASERLGWLATEDYRGEPYQEYKWKTKIFATTNGGDTWNLQFQCDGVSVNQIYFVNEQSGWVFGGKYWVEKEGRDNSFLILHTLNQGAEWKDVSTDLAQEENANVSVVWAGVSSQNKHSFIDQKARQFTLGVNEEKWEYQMTFPSLLLQDFVLPFAFLDDGRIWAKSGADSIEGMWGRIWLMSTNKSWDVFTIRGGVFIADAILLADNEIVACGSIQNSKKEIFDFSARDGLILHSKDGGKSWGVIYRSRKVAHISSLAKIDKEHFIAIGDKGVVLNFLNTE